MAIQTQLKLPPGLPPDIDLALRTEFNRLATAVNVRAAAPSGVSEVILQRSTDPAVQELQAKLSTLIKLLKQ